MKRSMDGIKVESDSNEESDVLSSCNESHSDEQVPFTFVAVNSEPEFYPGEGSMKEEQKCDIPCDENGPNVDGVRFSCYKENREVIHQQKFRWTKCEVAGQMKTRLFFGDEEFAEFIVDSDSDCEFSGGVSDSTESSDDLSVKRQKTVKIYGHAENHDFGSSEQNGEDNIPEMREVSEAPFTCLKCDVAPELDAFTANPGVKQQCHMLWIPCRLQLCLCMRDGGYI